jgi:hypothetical protein
MINICFDAAGSHAPVRVTAHQLRRVDAKSTEGDPSLYIPTIRHEKQDESLTPITLIESAIKNVDPLYQKKYALIDERNKNFASFFYNFNPFSKKRLAKIDKQIELIDSKIFSIESQNRPTEEDLNNIIERAQRKFDLLTMRNVNQNDEHSPNSVTSHKEV